MINKNYELIVVGGGFAGIGAAISAAREGVKTLIIERNAHLGGTTSSSVINPFMKYFLQKKDENGQYFYEQLNCGIFGEIVERLKKCGALDDSNKFNVIFNIEYMKKIMEDMCEEAGVDLLYQTVVTSAEVQDGNIKKICAYNKNGMIDFSADYFIDASGDGNLSVQAGAKFQLGREEDNLCQPMTLCFWLSNVDTKQYTIDKPSINPLYKQYQESGKIKNTRENVLVFKHIAPGVLHFNTTRIIGKNPTDAFDLTKAQIEARKQVFEMYDFLKANFKSFENSVLLLTAPEIGIRESRMIEGEYVYNLDDILNYTKFEDSIACGCYEVDIHNPSGTGTKLIYLARDNYYTIPARCLIPKGLNNLLVAGRCISSTHEAQSAYRIMPIVCNIGEGAGCMVAVDKLDKKGFRDINIDKVHKLLDKNGARY